MSNYNLIIIEGKQIIPFLNITEQIFYDKLWEWGYEDDLWDWIDEIDPNKEKLESIIHQYIDDNLLHKYEDDEINCFAFIENDIIKEYIPDENLYNFVDSKIKEHYD